MHISKRLLFWSVTIALGGFLFGFDTAVISGAEQAIQFHWSLNAFQQGFTVASALIGTVLGALLGSIPADRWGRKPSLLVVGILFLVSSLGSAMATGWAGFLVFRIAGGIAVGSSSVIAPIYISEISPARVRGKLVGMFQFNVVLGILVAYLSNYFIGNLLDGEKAWRFMLGVQALPSLAFILLLQAVPESPRWLILKRGMVEKAKQIFEVISPGQARQVISEIEQVRDRSSAGRTESIWKKKYRMPLLLAILLAFFNQFSGINAILYYAPRIFEMAGLQKNTSLLSTVGIGLVFFIFTYLALNVIDKMGRRKLMIIGSFGLIATLGMISFTFFRPDLSNWTIVVYMLLFIAFFAFSQGTVIWVFISEIFPNEVRAQGQAVGSFTHWSMDALIAFSFPWLVLRVGGGTTFLLFGIMMILQLLFAMRLMPETKGKSLEQMGAGIDGSLALSREPEP
jgi:sugar porter (SP) family MFS transporter